MNLKPIVIFLLFVIAFSAKPLAAQTPFEVPENYVLEHDSDYAKYEADIIAASVWLAETDLDKETDKRDKVNAFVLKWLAKSPTVTVNVYNEVTKLYQGNPILTVFLSAYARYVLEHKTEKGIFAPTKVGLQALMAIYKKGIGIKANKNMDKMIKMDAKGKLDDYIEGTIGIERED
jgi:hypothetical protein